MPGDHNSRCTVCRHPQCKEIEELFFAGALEIDLAELFGLTQPAISRHIKAKNLKRVKEVALRKYWTYVVKKSLAKAKKGKFTLSDGIKASELLAKTDKEDPLKDIWEVVMKKEGK